MSQPEATLTGSPAASREQARPSTPAHPRIRPMLLSASATALLQGASNAMSFALAVLLARFIGPAGYGRYALAFAWATFLMIPAILGLDRFLVRGIAVYQVQGQWQLAKGLLVRTNQLVLAVSVAVAAGGAVVAALWLPASLRTPFCVAMLLIPLTTLTLLRQAAMQAFGRVVSGQLPEYLIRPVLIIVGVLTLELIGGGALTPASALAANVAGVACAFACGAFLLARALPPALRAVRPRYLTGEWLRSSLPMMLITGVWAANSYAAILVVGSLAGPRAAGVYTAVQKGAELIVVLLVAINMPLAPAVARLHAHGDLRALELTTERMARATLLVSAPIAAVFILAPGLYLGIFGRGFQDGAQALVIVAIAQLANAIAGPAGNVLMMTGHERVAVRGVLAGLLVNLVLAIVLVPRLGVTGAAIAFASSLVLWNAVLVVMARRRVGVNVTALRFLSLQRLTETPVATEAR